jgi:hypothetical protein
MERQGRRKMIGFVRVLAIVGCLALATSSAQAEPQARLSPADSRALASAATRLRIAILNRDVGYISKILSPSERLMCTDTAYRKAQVVRYLSDANSKLYISLFDAPNFRRACGRDYPAQYPATSDKAFFEAAPNGVFEITPLGRGYATVKFVAPTANLYPREYDFKREGGEWKLVGGLIVGSCSCG